MVVNRWWCFAIDELVNVIRVVHWRLTLAWLDSGVYITFWLINALSAFLRLWPSCRRWTVRTSGSLMPTWQYYSIVFVVKESRVFMNKLYMKKLNLTSSISQIIIVTMPYKFKKSIMIIKAFWVYFLFIQFN